jgi:hypothetical protein
MSIQANICIKLNLSQIKIEILKITLSMRDDQLYSKFNAVDDLLKVVKEIESLESDMTNQI